MSDGADVQKISEGVFLLDNEREVHVHVDDRIRHYGHRITRGNRARVVSSFRAAIRADMPGWKLVPIYDEDEAR